jgi:DnaJ-class molecular chaperone
MPAPTQIPITPHTEPAARPCFWCNGSGRTPNDDEERYEDCNACEGSGTRQAPDLEHIAA